jgi:hypothetical protein
MAVILVSQLVKRFRMSTVFWNVTPCSLIDRYQHCCHLQDRTVRHVGNGRDIEKLVKEARVGGGVMRDSGA